MAEWNLTELDEKTLQAFRGRFLPPRTNHAVKPVKTGKCCYISGSQLEWLQSEDGLPHRVHYENRNIHEAPNGAKQTWDWNNSGFVRESQDLIANVQVGAKISTIAPPTYSLINSIGVGIENQTIPEGLKFKIATRNGTLDGVQAIVHKWVYTLDGCDVTVDYTKEEQSVEDIEIAYDDTENVVRTDYVLQFKADERPMIVRTEELQFEVTAYPNSDTFVPPEYLGLRMACNYDVVLRSEY